MLNAYYDTTGKGQKGEDVKLVDLLPYLRTLFQHELVVVASNPNGDMQYKMARTVEYLRDTMPNEVGPFRSVYHLQRNLLERYVKSPVVFVYASGLMNEEIKSKLKQLQQEISTGPYVDVRILAAESPRLTDCILTDFSTL